MRQVFAGWGVASKRKGRVEKLESYDILSAPVAADEYISCVEGIKAAFCSLNIIYFCYYHS